MEKKLSDYLDDNSNEIVQTTEDWMERLPKLHRLFEPTFGGELITMTWYEHGKPILAYYRVAEHFEKFMYENVENLDSVKITYLGVAEKDEWKRQ